MCFFEVGGWLSDIMVGDIMPLRNLIDFQIICIWLVENKTKQKGNN